MFAASASASDAGPTDSYRVLIYDYVPDILEKRGPYRAEHIGNAKKMVRTLSLGERRNNMRQRLSDVGDWKIAQKCCSRERERERDSME